MSKKLLYWSLLFVLTVGGAAAQARLSPFFSQENKAVIQAFLSTPSGTNVRDAFFSNTKIIVVWAPITARQDFFDKSRRLYELGKIKPKTVDFEAVAKEALKSKLDKKITERLEIFTYSEMRSQNPSFNPFRLDDASVVILQLKGTNDLLAGQDNLYIGAVHAEIFRLMPDVSAVRNASSMYSYSTANFFPKVYTENFEEPLTGAAEAAYVRLVSDVATSINSSW